MGSHFVSSLLGNFLRTAIVIGLCSPAWSNESLDHLQIPNLVRVYGVPDGDVLNIRSEPNGGSEDLGDLQNGDLVEITGFDDTRQWVRIIMFEGNGWLSARYLKKVEETEDSRSGMAYPLTCGGTEPFWTFNIGREGAVEWSALDIASASYSIDWAIRSRSLGSQAYAVGSGPFTAIVHRRECSDGMSDRSYGWMIDLVRKDGKVHELFGGCCRWQK